MWWWVLISPGVTRQPRGVDRASSPPASARSTLRPPLHEPVGDGHPPAVELAAFVVDGGDEQRVAHQQIAAACPVPWAPSP